MKKRIKVGMICALTGALSLGLLTACGGNGDPKTPDTPENLKITHDLNLSGKDVTYSCPLNASLNDDDATLVITVKKPDGTQTTVNAGDMYSFNTAGFYTVTYTATRGEETVTESVTDYVGLKGEAISFETAASGAAFAANTDWNAEHEINTEADYVKCGKQSLKGTFAEEGINGQNHITVAFSTAISVGTANHATLWIYSSEACELGIEAQEGTTWTWLGETKETLVEGWNEVSYDFNKEITDPVSGFKFVNYGANTPTLYFDAFCFASEWQIYENKDADTILNVGGTVSLSDFYTLFKGDGVNVSATAEKGTVNGLQYIAPNQGGQIDTVLLTAEKDGVEKTLTLTLQTKGAARLETWNMGVTEGFTLGAWKAVEGTDNMEVVENDAAEGAKAIKISVAKGGGVSFTCGTHAVNGATHARLRIYAEKACALTLSVQENGGDWVQLLGAEGAAFDLNAGWNDVTFEFSKAAEYPFNNFVFKPTSTATETTVIELDTVTFLKGESLLTNVDAESRAEVNEVFKPVVTVQGGGTYVLEITACPNGSTKPTVSDNGFTPIALGEYSYKITVSKDGYESEEYTYSVTVTDTTRPVIAGTPASVPTKFVGESITFADLIAGLTITDNYDTGLSLSFKELRKGDHTETVESGATGFTFTQSGNYTAIFSVKDSSNNETTVEIPVKVEGGIDFGAVDTVEIFVGDNLVVPEYTIPDTEGLTVSFYLDNSEITVGSDRNAGVQNTVGNYTLKAELKKADGTKIAEQTLTVKVKDITVTQNTQFVGKDVTYSEVLSGTTDDPKATVEIKVTKPNGETVTADESAFAFDAAGWYTVTFTAKKGGYTAQPVTVTGYVKLVNESYSFEDLTQDSTINSGGTDGGAVTLNTQADYVKFGKNSVKFEFNVQAYARTRLNADAVTNGKCNELAAWIYASHDCEVKLTVTDSNYANSAGNMLALKAGWNEVGVYLGKTYCENNADKMIAFWFEYQGGDGLTLYVDAVRYSYSWQIVEKADAVKEVDPNGTLDLSTLYTLVDGEDVTVTAAADVGTVNGLQYTAPAEGRKYATVTFTATKGGESKSLVVKVFVKGGEMIVATWNMDGTEDLTPGSWKWPDENVMTIMDYTGATDGKALQVVLKNSNGGGGGINLGCSNATIEGATCMKLRIYSEKDCSVIFRLSANGDPWNYTEGGDNGITLQLKQGWHEYTFEFVTQVTSSASFNFMQFKDCGEDITLYLDTVTFIKK